MESFVLAQRLMGESEALTAVVGVAAFWRKPAPNPEDRGASSLTPRPCSEGCLSPRGRGTRARVFLGRQMSLGPHAQVCQRGRDRCWLCSWWRRRDRGPAQRAKLAPSPEPAPVQASATAPAFRALHVESRGRWGWGADDVPDRGPTPASASASLPYLPISGRAAGVSPRLRQEGGRTPQSEGPRTSLLVSGSPLSPPLPHTSISLGKAPVSMAPRKTSLHLPCKSKLWVQQSKQSTAPRAADKPCSPCPSSPRTPAASPQRQPLPFFFF